MKRKTQTELQRAKINKVTRTLIRLKHSLAADEELNEVLPGTLEEFDAKVARKELSPIDHESALKLLEGLK